MNEDLRAIRSELQRGFGELSGAVTRVANEQLRQNQRIERLESARGGVEERARSAMQSSSDLRAELHELKDAFAKATPQQVTDGLTRVGDATKAQDKVLAKQTTLLQVIVLMTAIATAVNGYFTAHAAPTLAPAAHVQAAQ